MRAKKIYYTQLNTILCIVTVSIQEQWSEYIVPSNFQRSEWFWNSSVELSTQENQNIISESV